MVCIPIKDDIRFENSNNSNAVEDKFYAVIQLLKREYFNFKIYQVPAADVKDAILKINDIFIFCNRVNDKF